MPLDFGVGSSGRGDTFQAVRGESLLSRPNGGHRRPSARASEIRRITVKLVVGCIGTDPTLDCTARESRILPSLGISNLAGEKTMRNHSLSKKQEKGAADLT